MPGLVRRLVPQAIWSLPERRQEVFLTFDDGPHPRHTSELLTLLAAHGARVTFFLIGEKVRAYPQLLRDIHGAGHAIGNHTMHHRRLWWQGRAAVLEEIRAAQSVIEDGAGVAVRYFRPPYGALSPAVVAAADQASLRVAMWSCSPLDFRRANDPQAIATALAEHVRGGDLVLLHDGHACAPATLAALRATLPLLKEKGYRFAALPNHPSSQ